MFTQPVQLTRGKTDITNMVVHVLAMERLQKGAFMVIGMLCNGMLQSQAGFHSSVLHLRMPTCTPQVLCL
jgi:hypothetical protein